MKIYQRPSNQWTKWFAWHPVRTTSGEVVWLEFVQRKLYHCHVPNVVPSSWIIYNRLTK